MVCLVVENFEQISILEHLLLRNGVVYELQLSRKNIGLQPPHLVVDGVPIDMERSFKWIEGIANE